MEIYIAQSSYKAPPGGQNVMSFSKGDRFEVLEKDKQDKIWWGARSLQDNSIGYVPSNYLKYDERRVGKLLAGNYKNQLENHLKKLEDMEARRNNHMMPNIPEPDYQVEEVPENKDFHKPHGLIEPKKLPNPCLESKDKQHLHRELLMNSKTGFSVLKKKSELTRELEKRRESVRRKEYQEEQLKKRTSFELRLDQQANKLKESEKLSQVKEVEPSGEFLKMHARICSRSNENIDKIGSGRTPPPSPGNMPPKTTGGKVFNIS